MDDIQSWVYGIEIHHMPVMKWRQAVQQIRGGAYRQEGVLPTCTRDVLAHADSEEVLSSRGGMGSCRERGSCFQELRTEVESGGTIREGCVNGPATRIGLTTEGQSPLSHYNLAVLLH